MTDNDAEWDEPDPRFRYLTLLRDGYIAIGALVPVEVATEWAILKTGEDIRLARLEADRREAARALRERQEAPEAVLEEHWSNQRQFGKTEAAQRWADKYGQPLPVIIEVAETEEEMRDAIRKLRNVSRAKRIQGYERPGQGLEWRQPKKSD